MSLVQVAPLPIRRDQEAVSTWPEARLAHVDLFTCRADVDVDVAITPLLEALGGTIAADQRIPRLEPDAPRPYADARPEPSIPASLS